LNKEAIMAKGPAKLTGPLYTKPGKHSLGAAEVAGPIAFSPPDPLGYIKGGKGGKKK
jgi:hypothetical protein